MQTTAASGLFFDSPKFAPTLTSLAPNTAVHGAGATSITVAGTRFAPGAVVVWGATDVAATFGSATQLSFSATPAMLANAGTVAVKVRNLDGLLSGSVNFIIT